MKLYVPHYYKDFQCIASKCKDNCCYGGWEIDIDDETAKYYLSLEGEFGDRLRASIDRTDEYCFKLEDGHCPFLDDHNLCQIYQNIGEDKMGVVCTQFPRYSEYYGNRKETGIGLACEEAERIIFEDREPFHLVQMDCNEEEIEDPEYDKELADVLFKVRERIFTLINDESIPFYDVLGVLVALGDHIQTLVNEEEIHNDIYEKIEYLVGYSNDKLIAMKNEYLSKFSDQDKNNANSNINEDMNDILSAYLSLEVLNDDWPDFMDLVDDNLHSEEINASKYKSIINEYMLYNKDNEFQYRNMLQYFIFRYFMKAVYDHDVYAKLLMTVTNLLVIREMDVTRWLMNKKEFKFSDRVDTVHIFSREVEYSEDNLEDLKDEFLFDDIFKPENMILMISLM